MREVDESRRSFLFGGAGVAAAALTSSPLRLLAEPAHVSSSTAKPRFATADPRWHSTWDAALKVLAGNVRSLPGYSPPVLFEGSTYQGIWQECGPLEALVYAGLRAFVPVQADGMTPLEVARNSHRVFFSLQKAEGQLPASAKTTENGFGQIQMVVPIAATAWELSQMLKEEEFLSKAYRACSAWDQWLRTYRDTRKSGLVEGFCTYDTGHDNSPRWKGIPNRCPDADARKCPGLASLPRLCPDLSATVYGGRVALASMARALGKEAQAARWQEDAESLRRLIVDKLYSEEDAAFYDLDAENKFVRVRSDVMSRVLGEHVLKLEDAGDRRIFNAIWERQMHNPKAFWAPYPLSSIAQDDPTFVRPIPRNSWGGASQALTALRAPRWMSYYGKQAEFEFLMMQWCEAILRHTEFRQQIDPQTGVFTQPDPGGYSPAALVFLDFASRLGSNGQSRLPADA